MKIVSLERNSAGTDISMECFQDFGEVIYYGNTTTKEQVKERVQEAEIIIAKQRNGPIGTIELAWLPDYTQFKNLAK